MTETDTTTDARTDSPTDATDGSRRPSLRSVLNVLGIVLLLAIVAPFVVYAVPGVVGADASFVVLSGSMEPSISAGDVVVAESMPPAAVAVDDVITFSRTDEGATVTHRVIDIDDTGDERVFYTKGDANEDPDQRPVPASALVGTVVVTIPYIGYVIQFVGTTTGFALLVVLPFGALVVTEAVSLLRRRRRASADTEPPSPAQERQPTSVDIAAAAPHVSRANGDGPVRPLRPPRASYSKASPSTEGASGTMAIASTDILLTIGVLAAVLPYLAFVALEQQSALSIGVAVGFGTAFALLAGVFLTARLAERSNTASTPSRPRAASDGGSVPEEER